MPYTPPGDDELFEWLTGETDATLREVQQCAGYPVVTWRGPAHLASVIRCFLTTDNITQLPQVLVCAGLDLVLIDAVHHTLTIQVQALLWMAQTVACSTPHSVVVQHM